MHWWLDVAGPALMPEEGFGDSAADPEETSLPLQGRVALVLRSSLSSHLLALGLAAAHNGTLPRLPAHALGPHLRRPLELARRDLLRRRSANAAPAQPHASAAAAAATTATAGVKPALVTGPRPPPRVISPPAPAPAAMTSAGGPLTIELVPGRKNDLAALRAALLGEAPAAAPPAEAPTPPSAARDAVLRAADSLLAHATTAEAAESAAEEDTFDASSSSEALHLRWKRWRWVGASAFAAALLTLATHLWASREAARAAVWGPKHSGGGLTARRVSLQGAAEPESPVPPGVAPPGAGPGGVPRPTRLLLEPSPSQVAALGSMLACARVLLVLF